MSNTITSGAMYLAWLFCLRRKLKELIENDPSSAAHYELYLELLEDYIREFRAKFFGDDGIVSVPIGLCKIICLSRKIRKDTKIPKSYDDLPTFEEFLINDCDMALKIEDSGEYPHLYTLVDDQDKIVLKGPSILKRHFVPAAYDDKQIVIAWRPCQMWKIATPTLEFMTYPHQVMRLLGHLWDTMGNNEVQYKMVLRCLLHTLDKIPGAQSFQGFYKTYILHGLSYESESIRRELTDKIERLMGEDSIKVDLSTIYDTIPTMPYLQQFFNKPNLGYSYPKPSYDWTEYQASGRT
jgi:hypothetical protein